MRQIPTLGEVMTVASHTIGLDDSIRVAKSNMAKHGIKHLPVITDGHFTGVVTDRDIKLAQAVSLDKNFHNTAKVRDALTPDPYAVPRSTPLDQALTTMVDRGIGSVIVVEDGKPLGIFTRTDACRFLKKLLRSHADSQVS